VELPRRYPHQFHLNRDGPQRLDAEVVGRAAERDRQVQRRQPFADLADGVWTLRVEMLGFSTINQDVTFAPDKTGLFMEVKCELPLPSIAPGQIYYFQPRFVNGTGEMQWGLAQPYAPDGPPLERLRGFFEATHAQHRKISKECGRVAGCPLGSLAQEMSSQDPVLRKKLGEVFERHVGKFERVVAEAVGRGDLARLDARRAARSLTALLQGAVLLAKTWDDPELLAGLKDDALRLLGVAGAKK
jgi:AcrR family transcriptional regulator